MDCFRCPASAVSPPGTAARLGTQSQGADAFGASRRHRPVRALRLGASGYLCKRAAPEEFLRAVGQVAGGRRYLDPELAQTVALAQLSGSAQPVETLTEKELAVFLKLAEGRSVNEVAADFCLSPSTVGTHLYHIKQKLNVQNAAELTLVAVRNGLLEV
jgi:two-component system invasion response regulator UvrY